MTAQTQLVRYEAARAALAEAHRVDEVKDIRDKAHAIAAYARQANDTDMVEWATEIKVRAERRAGELLAAMEKAPGGQPYRSTGSTLAPVGIRPTLAELGVDKKQSARWQKLAAVPAEQFEQAVEAAKEVAREVTTSHVLKLSSMGVHYSSATDDWGTPQDLFDALDAEFGFTLDVCANPANAKCAEFFTVEDDGLAQTWEGVCWMNPPYGDVIPAWIRKAYESAQAGTTVVCLVPARVDTAWWWDYCRYGEIRFLRGRLKFGGAESSAPFPSAVIVFPRKPNVVWWMWEAPAA